MLGVGCVIDVVDQLLQLASNQYGFSDGQQSGVDFIMVGFEGVEE